MNSRPSPRDQARRELSQNFLTDPLAVRQFLEAAELGADDVIVEVGAGAGALTTQLAPRVRQVIAYEVDRALAPQLRAAVGQRDNVDLVFADFLGAPPPPVPFKVVSNVPFGATAGVVDWTLRAENLTAATMITQLEYAKKRTGGYGRWSLMTIATWPEYEWTLRGQLPRTSFRPVPKVDAGILHLVRRRHPLVDLQVLSDWHDLVELGFSGIGGSLFASLCREHPRARVVNAFTRSGTAGDTVVAFVTPQEWLVIFWVLQASQRRDRPARR